MKNKSYKLFGMFNALDVVVMGILALIFVPMVYYYMRLNDIGYKKQLELEKVIKQSKIQNLMKKDDVLYEPEKTSYIDLTVSFKNLDKDILQNINVGDKDIALDGTVLAEILEIGASGPNYYYMPHFAGYGQAYPKVFQDNKKLSLKAKIRVRGFYDGNIGSLFYKGEDITRRGNFTFSTDRYSIYFSVEMNIGND